MDCITCVDLLIVLIVLTSPTQISVAVCGVDVVPEVTVSTADFERRLLRQRNPRMGCVGGWSSRSVSRGVFPPGEYVVVVEGADAQDGAFQLSVGCAAAVLPTNGDGMIGCNDQVKAMALLSVPAGGPCLPRLSCLPHARTWHRALPFFCMSTPFSMPNLPPALLL